MKVFFGSVIIIILLAGVVWYTLSPLFNKVGKFTKKQTKKFQNEWEKY